MVRYKNIVLDNYSFFSDITYDLFDVTGYKKEGFFFFVFVFFVFVFVFVFLFFVFCFFVFVFVFCFFFFSDHLIRMTFRTNL